MPAPVINNPYESPTSTPDMPVDINDINFLTGFINEPLIAKIGITGLETNPDVKVTGNWIGWKYRWIAAENVVELTITVTSALLDAIGITIVATNTDGSTTSRVPYRFRPRIPVIDDIPNQTFLPGQTGIDFGVAIAHTPSVIRTVGDLIGLSHTSAPTGVRITGDITDASVAELTRDHGSFIVSAANATGAAPSKTGRWGFRGVPKKPEEVTVRELNASLQVMFGYVPSFPDLIRVEVQLDNGTWVTATDNDHHIFTGLTNSQAYTIRVRGVNSIGNGIPSDAITATPNPNPAVPLAPLDVSITTATSGTVTVSWTRGFAFPALSSQEIRFNTDQAMLATQGWTRIGATDTSYNITSGVSNGQTLYVEIRGVNSQGNGAAVSASSVIGPRMSVRATAGNMQATFVWTAIQGATTYSYRVGTTGTWTSVSNVTSFTVTGLTNNQATTVQWRVETPWVGPSVSVIVTGTTDIDFWITYATSKTNNSVRADIRFRKQRFPLTGTTLPAFREDVAFLTNSQQGTFTNIDNNKILVPADGGTFHRNILFYDIRTSPPTLLNTVRFQNRFIGSLVYLGDNKVLSFYYEPVFNYIQLLQINNDTNTLTLLRRLSFPTSIQHVLDAGTRFQRVCHLKTDLFVVRNDNNQIFIMRMGSDALSIEKTLNLDLTENNTSIQTVTYLGNNRIGVTYATSVFLGNFNTNLHVYDLTNVDTLQNNASLVKERELPINLTFLRAISSSELNENPLIDAVPETPSNFTPALSGDDVILTWGIPKSFPGPSRHQIRTALTEATLPIATWTDLGGNITTYTYTNLDYGSTHFFEVRAGNDEGNSAGAIVNIAITGVPRAPTNVTVTETNTRLVVTWDEIVSNPVLLRAEIRLDSGRWIHANSTTTHTFSGLTNGRAYTIRVRGVNNSGNGLQSAPITATPNPIPAIPATPTNLVLELGDRQIVTTWDLPIGFPALSSQDIRWATSETALSTASWTSIGATDTTYTITGLTNGNTYYVEVRGVNTVGNGPATRTSGLLDPTFTVAASATTSSITYTWTAVNDALSYAYRIGETGNFIDVGNVTTFTLDNLSEGVERIVFWRVNTPWQGEPFKITISTMTSTIAPMWRTIPLQAATVGQRFTLDLKDYVTAMPAPTFTRVAPSTYGFLFSPGEQVNLEMGLSGTSTTIAGAAYHNNVVYVMNTRNSRVEGLSIDGNEFPSGSAYTSVGDVRALIAAPNFFGVMERTTGWFRGFSYGTNGALTRTASIDTRLVISGSVDYRGGTYFNKKIYLIQKNGTCIVYDENLVSPDVSAASAITNALQGTGDTLNMQGLIGVADTYLLALNNEGDKVYVFNTSHQIQNDLEFELQGTVALQGGYSYSLGNNNTAVVFLENTFNQGIFYHFNGPGSTQDLTDSGLIFSDGVLSGVFTSPGAYRIAYRATNSEGSQDGLVEIQVRSA